MRLSIQCRPPPLLPPCPDGAPLPPGCGGTICGAAVVAIATGGGVEVLPTSPAGAPPLSAASSSACARFSARMWLIWCRKCASMLLFSLACTACICQMASSLLCTMRCHSVMADSSSASRALYSLSLAAATFSISSSRELSSACALLILSIAAAMLVSVSTCFLVCSISCTSLSRIASSLPHASRFSRSSSAPFSCSCATNDRRSLSALASRLARSSFRSAISRAAEADSALSLITSLSSSTWRCRSASIAARRASSALTLVRRSSTLPPGAGRCVAGDEKAPPLPLPLLSGGGSEAARGWAGPPPPPPCCSACCWSSP
mmetsp:Transcript_3426/g.8942  ORF Transcript_3426/g.8942 Transcript_3426/m.8942 type:complete len:319 (+) Transcript_3426:886-1842(+)